MHWYNINGNYTANEINLYTSISRQLAAVVGSWCTHTLVFDCLLKSIILIYSSISNSPGFSLFLSNSFHSVSSAPVAAIRLPGIYIVLPASVPGHFSKQILLNHLRFSMPGYASYNYKYINRSGRATGLRK